MAGYPFTINVTSYDKVILASGQPYTGKIKVELLDADFNIIKNDNRS